MPYYDHLSAEIKNKSKYFNDALISIGSRVSDPARTIDRNFHPISGWPNRSRIAVSQRNENECLSVRRLRRVRLPFQRRNGQPLVTVLKKRNISCAFLFRLHLRSLLTARATANFLPFTADTDREMHMFSKLLLPPFRKRSGNFQTVAIDLL